VIFFLLMMSCRDTENDTGEFVFPEADANPALRGPGGPAVDFESPELWENCATLPGGEEDVEHHNMVVPYRGHLVMPWAPEWGQGGLSFFDMSDPCDPIKVGEGFHERMRETHSMGFVHLSDGEHAGDYVAVNGMRGIQIWDITDETSPEMISYLEMEDVFYPDAYSRVVLSVFWQYPWLYAAVSDNGIYVMNVEDPHEPELVHTMTFSPELRAGGVFVLGTLMLVTSAEGTESVLLDVSTPDSPQLIAGGRFESVDAKGESWEAYHGNIAGDLALYARKEGGSGVMVVDISDPSQPTYMGDYHNPSGNGGYVFYDEGYAFVGESDFASVYDMRDPTNITMLGQGYLAGDLDTMTPYGNVAILSVDDDAEDEIASVVMPWTEGVDLTAPEVMRVVPEDGAVGVATTARIGICFNEFIEPSSVFAGSIRVWDASGQAVNGWGSGQENIASFAPRSPLQPGTTYTIEVMADGVMDINGNRVSQMTSSTFTTAGQ